MYIIGCPECDYKGPLKSYAPSCADECTCPKCECFFTIQWDDLADEGEEDE